MLRSQGTGTLEEDGLIAAAVATGPGRCEMYWNGHGMGAWGWFAMSFTQLIVWILILTAVVLMVRTFRHDTAGRSASEPGAASSARAENLLAERFARGEIDDEEFKRRLATLRGNAPGPKGW
ncbi:SHOCT domain-containing protein [Streptomyces sp. NPDC059533]|uniref:SHOCT domain-containing protein n=2 Tax=unclassified Streptomyces TaxID=2593676 RepID=UPI00368FB586